MQGKVRFSIRAKLAVMSMITIAVSVTTLGVVLTATSANNAQQTASNNLASVALNADMALEGAITSVDTSMKLLSSQIGYNHDFASSILDASTSTEAANQLKKAMSGTGLTGDGSTIVGAMDYLVITDHNIVSATMYSPFISPDKPVANRLFHVSQSAIECTEARYAALKEHPGLSYWFFNENDSLYVWKALVNYGVDDVYDMQVVGYVEYGFDRDAFLECITGTSYEDEGMLLFDENDKLVLQLTSGEESIDKAVLDNYVSLRNGLQEGPNYTVYRADIASLNWKYVAFINHRSLQKALQSNIWFSVLVVSVAVALSVLAAIFLSSHEVKRIRNLSKAAGEISEGHYDVRVKKAANDEITDVGESFNAMATKVQESLQELIDQQDSISENFATILSNKSGESGNHVKRVGEYSAILAEEMGFNPSQIHDIRIAAMLHDVGKIMVDEKILHKPGRFTDEEYKIMQQHVDYGGQLLKGVPGNIMQLGAVIAQYHHERWDGNGYTHHLKGDEIPVEAQIASVADVFDALVSKRCYKDAWTIEQARDEIIAQAGKQFSPKAVEAFEKRFEDFKHIAEIYKDQ
ncbi:MAG: HD domain-containing protein [Bacilli bacterium]|nr:HD domain-containing protein [Bacilli bacterium]